MRRRANPAIIGTLDERIVTGEGPHKYRATPTMVDGIRFASRREANRYCELKLLEKAGEIQNLVLQPRFALVVDNVGWPFSGDGRTIKLGEYRGDFQYDERFTPSPDDWDEREWRTVVEDVKGFKTPLYRWKKKHVEAQYGIQIRET